MPGAFNLNVEVVTGALLLFDNLLDLLPILRGKVAGQERVHVLPNEIFRREPILGRTSPGEVQDVASGILHEEDIIRLLDEIHQPPIRPNERVVLAQKPAGVHDRAFEEVIEGKQPAGEEDSPRFAVVPAKRHLRVSDVAFPHHLLDEPCFAGFVRPERLRRDADEFPGGITEHIGTLSAGADNAEGRRIAEEPCMPGIPEDLPAPGGGQVRVLRKERRGPEDP